MSVIIHINTIAHHTPPPAVSENDEPWWTAVDHDGPWWTPLSWYFKAKGKPTILGDPYFEKHPPSPTQAPRIKMKQPCRGLRDSGTRRFCFPKPMLGITPQIGMEPCFEEPLVFGFHVHVGPRFIERIQFNWNMFFQQWSDSLWGTPY